MTLKLAHSIPPPWLSDRRGCRVTYTLLSTGRATPLLNSPIAIVGGDNTNQKEI
jgi:hypothetical protein